MYYHFKDALSLSPSWAVLAKSKKETEFKSAVGYSCIISLSASWQAKKYYKYWKYCYWFEIHYTEINETLLIEISEL